ncbi:Uncharacterised protein [Serratia fonticola]|uniref:hypothetical protein n=1 Tax=Serratia fonticola TaxID=47917 RepID=UPI002178BDC7|nr:hypothetical protein [Serratia fonticola]CAI1133853.1 Uncharacterised protein [Serratia fonticola]
MKTHYQLDTQPFQHKLESPDSDAHLSPGLDQYKGASYMITTNIITSSTDWMRARPSVQAVRRDRSSQPPVEVRKFKLVKLLIQKGNPI